MEVYKFTGTDFSSKAKNFLANSLLCNKNNIVSYVDNRTYRIIKQNKYTPSLASRIFHVFLRIASINLTYILAKTNNRLLEKKVKPLIPHIPHDLDGRNSYSPINFRDTLFEISKFLEPKDWKNLKLASKHHNKVLSESLIRYLNDNPHVSLHTLGFTTPEKCLHFIKQNAAQITSINIHSVRFNNSQTNELFNALIDCKNLTHVNLSSEIKVTDQHLELLGKCLSLKELHLENIEKITDTGLAHIQSLKNLETLDFSSNTNSNVTHLGISYLTQLTKLKSLEIQSFHKLSYKGLKEICKLKGLESLWFLALSVKAKGFKELSNLENLKTLGIGFAFEKGNDKIIEIAKLSQLQELHLSHFDKYTMEGFLKLSNLTNLKVLNLTGNHDLTDKMLKVIAGFHKLTFLDLSACNQVTDRGIEELQKLEHLKTIKLWSTGVSKSICDIITKQFSSSPKVFAF